MRITKESLKQIIKEELKNLIDEGSDWYSDEYETLADKKFADSQRDPAEEFFRNYGLEPKDGKVFISYDRDDWKEIIYQIDGELDYEPRDDLGGMMVTLPVGD
jgi:hypothetical protein